MIQHKVVHLCVHYHPAQIRIVGNRKVHRQKITEKVICHFGDQSASSISATNHRRRRKFCIRHNLTQSHLGTYYWSSNTSINRDPKRLAPLILSMTVAKKNLHFMGHYTNPSSGKMHDFFCLKFPDSEQILPSTLLMRRILMCLDPENIIAVTSVYCLLNIKIVSFQQLFPAWKDRFPAVLYRAPAHSIERSHTSSSGCPAILFLSNQLEEFLFCL